MSIRKLLMVALLLVIVVTAAEKTYRYFFPLEEDVTRGGLDKTFNGVGAFVELLRASELDVVVDYSPPGMLPETGGVAWLISPTNLFPDDGEDLVEWIVAGGTAILALPEGGVSPANGAFFGELELPVGDSSWANYLRSGELTGEILVRSRSSTDQQQQVWLNLPEIADGWVPVLEIDEAPLVWERRFGSGKAVFVNSSQLFQNITMHFGGNALLAYDIARHYQAGHESVIINRYGNIPHQAGSLWQLILRPPFRHVTLFASLLVALAVWSSWFSPRPAMEPPVELHRERSEYVTALAQLAGGAHNRASVLELYRGHVASQLHAGREARPADSDALADRARKVFGLTEGEIQEILLPLAVGPLSEKDLLDQATRLEAISNRITRKPSA